MRSIVLDTIGKLHQYGNRVFAFCADCGDRYRKDRTPHNPPSSWTVDLLTLIAERGRDSPVIRMAPVPCPYCGGRRVDFRIAGPRSARALLDRQRHQCGQATMMPGWQKRSFA